MIDPRNPRFDFQGTHKSTRLEITAHILRCFELEIKEREVKIMNLASCDTDDDGNPMDIVRATKVTDMLAPLVTACHLLSPLSSPLLPGFSDTLPLFCQKISTPEEKIPPPWYSQ